MKSIKEKAKEYAKTKHTNLNLIDIVSWDFEAGANYVLDEIGVLLEAANKCESHSIPTWRLRYIIKQLKK